MPVCHRPRVAGETKYGFGITKRALPGLVDLFAVRWMSRRRRPILCEEIGCTEEPPLMTIAERPSSRTDAARSGA
jgi:hypothetical protein